MPPRRHRLTLLQVVGAVGLKGSLLDKMDPFVKLELRQGRAVKVRAGAARGREHLGAAAAHLCRMHASPSLSACSAP